MQTNTGNGSANQEEGDVVEQLKLGDLTAYMFRVPRPGADPMNSTPRTWTNMLPKMR